MGLQFLLYGVLLVVAMAILPGCGEEAIGYKLAVIDGEADPSASLVDQYEKRVSLLAERYGKDEKDIANQCVKCKQLLAHDDRDVSCLTLLWTAQVLDPTGTAKLEDIFAMLASGNVGFIE